MSDWDWNDIVIVSGEWWVFTICLLVFIVGLAGGFLAGKAYRDRDTGTVITNDPRDPSL